ncbi:hypothetical protein EC973_005945 [Apophysomyces ossiformis]|uniref:CN hydrolase domain-containing protein n=1 Tax=Apophysomyces ossiformis TaxID=679940 RepID=A0A8H7BVS2_9FUNG|nr:hypothetical protein EC973_005945 [Apophysomyces ossiformis]
MFAAVKRSFLVQARRNMSNVLAPASAFKLALLQLKGGADKKANLDNARAKILEAASNGANVVVLPEIFNSPYSTTEFPKYAEALATGESVKMLSSTAKEAGVYLFGGSIPERDENTGNIYNTLTVYNPSGEMIGIHRKVHLFDIDIPGKIQFKESDILSSGDSLTHIDTSKLIHNRNAVMISVCNEKNTNAMNNDAGIWVRSFPELAMIAARKGCMAMIYPGAFNLTTGPLHWELLQRARATDNQIYVAACSPARNLDATYHAWGHSTVVDPKGTVIATTDENESIVYADIDPEEIRSIRAGIPLYEQRRFDIYGDVAETVEIKDGKGFKKSE